MENPNLTLSPFPFHQPNISHQNFEDSEITTPARRTPKVTRNPGKQGRAIEELMTFSEVGKVFVCFFHGTAGNTNKVRRLNLQKHTDALQTCDDGDGLIGLVDLLPQMQQNSFIIIPPIKTNRLLCCNSTFHTIFYVTIKIKMMSLVLTYHLQ